jgi:hypothetical protein
VGAEWEEATVLCVSGGDLLQELAAIHKIGGRSIIDLLVSLECIVSLPGFCRQVAPYAATDFRSCIILS